MDAETREKIEELEARLDIIESALGAVEDVDVWSQHREFAASVQAKREREQE